MNERIEQGLAGEIGARENVGKEDRRRKAAGDANQRHLQAQDDDPQFDATRHDARYFAIAKRCRSQTVRAAGDARLSMKRCA